MTALDNIAMPSWALNEGAQTLLEQIIRDRPEPRIDDACGFKVATYRGKTAALLRRMHDDWVSRELAILDAAERWDREAGTALARTEDADQLIARVLAETAETILELEAEDVGGGTYRVAA